MSEPEFISHIQIETLESILIRLQISMGWLMVLIHPVLINTRPGRTIGFDGWGPLRENKPNHNFDLTNTTIVIS